MNIVFLDIDGVLNSSNYFKNIANKYEKPYSIYNEPFDSVCMANLKVLIENTNSNIVIISSYRKDKEAIGLFMNALKEYGLYEKVIGMTPILGIRREDEIKMYISTIKECVNFIILDDANYYIELYDNLIRVDNKNGLSIDNVKKGIEKMNKSLIKK